jgi:sugar transferase (PEP-CTERM system associated)
LRIFAHHIASHLVLIAVVDFVLAFASVFLAYFALRSAELGGPLGVHELPLAVYAGLFAVAVTAALAAMGLYGIQQRYGIEGAVVRIAVGIVFAAIGIALLDFLFNVARSPAVWVLAFCTCAMALAIARIVFARVVGDEIFRRRVLVYGAGKRAARILELRRRSDQRGFRVVLFVPAVGDGLTIEDPRVAQGTPRPLSDYVREHAIDEIVVAMDDRRRGFPVRDLLACKLAGVRVIDLLEFLERETGRIKVDLLNPAWLIFSDGFGRTGGDRWTFRALDLAVAAVVSVFALPIAVCVAIAIVIDDGRPVLYRQRRVGVAGRGFTLYKFRSMRKDAEAGGATWASREDNRVTRVGRILRSARFDEIPQLFNILRGDMSLVGPRPERPEFVEQLGVKVPYYHERHCVKPGLTGWAQLCYPYGASADDALAKLEYDMYYIKNRSLLFNLIILLQTAEVVLWQKGSR